MTTHTEALKQLQARIRESTGPDRGLDWLIVQAFLPPEKKFGMKKAYCTPYTASLDACVQLLNAALPGKDWRRLEGGWFFIAGEVHAKPLATDCHTFLDAIVAAALAEEEDKEKVA